MLLSPCEDLHDYFYDRMCECFIEKSSSRFNYIFLCSFTKSLLTLRFYSLPALIDGSTHCLTSRGHIKLSFFISYLKSLLSRLTVADNWKEHLTYPPIFRLCIFNRQTASSFRDLHLLSVMMMRSLTFFVIYY